MSTEPKAEFRVLEVANHGKVLFTIQADGRVVLGDGVPVDAASQAFWDAVNTMRPTCPSCGGPRAAL